MEAGGAIRALIIDDTGIPKKGTHAVGVARQCGQLGKQGNCQVAVTLSVANDQASLLIAHRLYLRRAWADDPERRRRLGPICKKAREEPRFSGKREYLPNRGVHHQSMASGFLTDDTNRCASDFDADYRAKSEALCRGIERANLPQMRQLGGIGDVAAHRTLGSVREQHREAVIHVAQILRQHERHRRL